MSTHGSVTRWIMLLQAGNHAGAQPLWDRYIRRMAGVARLHLGASRRGAGDESDVALEAFHSFCRGIEEGRFDDLKGRDELWRVLAVIAKHKAINWLRHELAQIRGGGKIQGDAFLSDVADSEPTPEVTTAMLDELQHMLAVLRLEDATLSLIALRKSEGCSNREIAAELALSPRTVERKLVRINILWAADLERRFGSVED